MRRFVGFGATAAVVLAVGLPRPAAAQSGLIGAGYVANAPDALVGGALWALPASMGGWGVYVDAKFDPDNRTSDGVLFSDLSTSDVESQFPDDKALNDDEQWYSINAALARSLTPELIVYAGGGLAHRTVYRRYLDPAQQRGQFGHYWIEVEEDNGSTVNVMAGALIRASSRVRLQFGAESAPTGFTVGASIVFGGR